MNTAGPRARRASGFSLLEVLLVVAILAIASVLATAVVRSGFPGVQLRSSAREIAAQLRYTRAQAIVTGTAQRFTLDPAAHAWTAAGKRNGEIPEQLSVSFIGAREVQPREGEGAIVFFPDGASTGGRVRLSVRNAIWHVDVAWLTGEVRARRAEGER